MHSWGPNNEEWCEGWGINPETQKVNEAPEPVEDPWAKSGTPPTDTEKDETDTLLEGRRSTYGNVTENAERVAKMWNGYLGIDVITPADMMMMMALYKAYRFKVTPDYADNINDVLGYGKIVKQVQEETGGLIEAETVKEYTSKKALREKSNPQLDQTEGRLMEQYGRMHSTDEDSDERDLAQALFRTLYDAGVSFQSGDLIPRLTAAVREASARYGRMHSLDEDSDEL